MAAVSSSSLAAPVPLVRKRQRDSDHEAELEEEELHARRRQPQEVEDEVKQQDLEIDAVGRDGPPWFDEYTGEQLDQQVQEGMKNDMNSWR